MITVIEKWYLRADLADRGQEIMQEMDDLVGPGAHKDPAWCGHAHFYRSKQNSNEFLMMYSWRSIEEHGRLRAREEPLLQEFYRTYCAAKRDLSYFEELEVEVERDHDHAC